MKNSQYKLLGKTCGGKTLPGSDLKLYGDGDGDCPAVIEEGTSIIVIGEKLDDAEARRMGVGINQQAVRVTRELILCSAQEMFLAAKKIA